MRAWALGTAALLWVGCVSESESVIPQAGTPETPAAPAQTSTLPEGLPDDFFEETGKEPEGDTETAAPTETAPTAPPTPVTPPATGQLAVTVANAAPAVRLNETKEISALVTPGTGFSGTVTLALEGLPAGVTAKIEPATADITGPLNVKILLSVPSDATATANIPVTLKATSGTTAGSAALALNIPNELLINIPAGVARGTQAAPNQMAFGAPSIPVLLANAGTKVTFVNQDGIPHRIHANGVGGLGHEPGNLLPNGGNQYTDTLTAKATVNFRCHIHPGMIGQIVVK